MIRVVFFDIDDTLLSFSGYVKTSMKEGFSKFGLKPYRDEMYPVFERINTALWRQIEQGVLTLDELRKIRWNRIFRELDISFDGPSFEKYFADQLFTSAVLENHAAELLEYLSPRYTLCAASNGPYEQQVNRLKLGNLLDYFSHVFVSSSIGAQKPDRQFFDICFQTLRAGGLQDLKPEETMIIGDSLTSDMAGGANYGMKTCLYKKPAPSLAEGTGRNIISSGNCSSVCMTQSYDNLMDRVRIDYVVPDLLKIREIL